MKVYGYIRDISGNFADREEKIIITANLLDLRIDKLYTEKSDGLYKNMIVAKEMIKNIHDCILILPDTSDLYFDEETMFQIMPRLNENHVFVIDCNYLRFDNIRSESKFSKDCPFFYLSNNLMIQVERHLRNIAEYNGEEIIKEVKELKDRIKIVFEK